MLRHPLDEKNKLSDTGDTFDDLLLKVNDALMSYEVHNYVVKLNTLTNENNVERLIPILQESFRNYRNLKGLRS